MISSCCLVDFWSLSPAVCWGSLRLLLDFRISVCDDFCVWTVRFGGLDRTWTQTSVSVRLIFLASLPSAGRRSDGADLSLLVPACLERIVVCGYMFRSSRKLLMLIDKETIWGSSVTLLCCVFGWLQIKAEVCLKNFNMYCNMWWLHLNSMTLILDQLQNL